MWKIPCKNCQVGKNAINILTFSLMEILVERKKAMPKINHNHNQADRHNNTITLTGCLSGPLKCPDPEPTPALQVLR